ncbi:MAG: radical SAM protein, partial [Clostridia bacterium]
QSGSNAILKSMNRKYTVEYYKEIVDKIKSKIPNIKLSSDFIVGFPGETDFDFQQTLSLVKYVKYENLFAFIYSKRSGTVAEKMENQISDDVKTERVNTLLNLQKQMHKGN